MLKTSFPFNLNIRGFIFILTTFLVLLANNVTCQPGGIKWSGDGNSYFRLSKNQIIKYSLPENKASTLVSIENLTPAKSNTPISVSYYKIDENQGKALLMANAVKVWRLKTRGDYWVLDMKSGSIEKLGRDLPPSSLMFAKISPDGKYAAYVSGNNIYSEDLITHTIKALTNDGSVTLINGTFDWAYEEEFFCRDGFRWSNDSKSIAFWQIDAGSIRKFNMINTTDSIYPQVIPIEYPVAGEDPSSARIGVVNILDGKTTWMKIQGDPVQNYIVRMEYIPATGKLLVQQLNRKQNHSRLIISDPVTGESGIIQEETDEAWVDLITGENTYSIDYTNSFTWINEGHDILWASEKDGWRHLYQLPLDGKPEKLLTVGNYDVISLENVDAKTGFIYFMASPENATQNYLYRTSLKKQGKPELISPASLKGTHSYSISPNGKYAYHTFSNHFTRPSSEFIAVSGHKPLNENESIIVRQDSLKINSTTEFFTITIPGNIELDGMIAKPRDFDPAKKYPVLFYVYTEPAGATVRDGFGADRNSLYNGDLTGDGYIYISIDNRGTPAPKGRAWRKSIYRKVGQINIEDQAMAARELLKKWSFLDPERVAVWGWSGGGTATLNLMFQYPEIYKTGISIAAVGNMFTYDNIYQERYMGLPQENKADYIKGSPITYAGNLKGNLLYIHGTGDDNVHYANAEMLINELIKNKKIFQFMPYPNRTHGISEGEGTTEHLQALFTDYLRRYCPPGPR
ncbi:MAG: DPP IV N-terminal domain-containing protein [Bacteroidetes bacterium]|nr:DPP IV N-terminal domain-containing protein [Bacteroidota bacterium]